MPVIVLVTVSDVVHCVDGKRTASLGAIEGDEPSLTAAATASHVKVALENNTENGVVPLLDENAILKSNEAYYMAHAGRQRGRHSKRISS